MFEWSKGSDLRALVRAKIPGAAYDDWLEGWTHGIVQHRFKLWSPVEMLDIELGEGPRPHREMFAGQGARVEAVAAAELSSADELARRRRKYGLVTLLSLEREQCLEPLDLGRPLPFVELLLNASTLLQNGGVLIWSYPYCFSRGPDTVRSFLEPDAVFQILEQRDFVPMAYDYPGTGKVSIFHHPDTLFVRQKALLEHSPCQERVTRICCAVRRRGRCRVGYIGPRKHSGGLLGRRWRALRRRVSFMLRG